MRQKAGQQTRLALLDPQLDERRRNTEGSDRPHPGEHETNNKHKLCPVSLAGSVLAGNEIGSNNRVASDTLGIFILYIIRLDHRLGCLSAEAEEGW